MTTTTLTTLLTRHGNLHALSNHLLGEEWSRARYDTLRRMVAAGELTGWPAALVEKELEAEELRNRIAELEKELETAREGIKQTAMETVSRTAYIVATADQEWEWTSEDNRSRVGDEISYEPEEIRVDICWDDDHDPETGKFFNYWKCYRVSE